MDALKERILQLLTLDYVTRHLLPAACIFVVAYLAGRFAGRLVRALVGRVPRATRPSSPAAGVSLEEFLAQ